MRSSIEDYWELKVENWPMAIHVRHGMLAAIELMKPKIIIASLGVGLSAGFGQNSTRQL